MAESWAWTSLGVKEQLLIFSSCLSPGRVKKLQKFISFCLKVGHSAYLKHSKFTWRKLIVMRLLSNVPNQHIVEQEWSTRVVVLISGAFVRSQLITNGIYIWVKLANHSARNNLFLTLCVIHKFKKQWTTLGRLSTENGSAVDCWMALWNLIVSLWQDVIHCVHDPQQSTAVKRQVLRDTLKNTVFPSIPH